nr:flagellar filament capping protein FliD [Polymorphobacter sp.]
MRDAINRSSAGITASIVSNAGSATLSLRGAEGEARAFIISAAGEPGLARFAYTPGNRAMSLVTAAGDADLNVDGIAVKRSSNVIDDLITGARVRLVKADAAATVTISAGRDGAQLSATVADFASTLGAMRALIGDLRKGAAGSEAAGALANDPTVRTMDLRLAGLVTAPVAAANGLRLRDVGVNITRDGNVAFDAARFAALPPTRYGDVEALLKSLVAPALSTQPNRLQSIAALATPASAGLSRRRTGVTGELAKVDVRLATYRTNLTRQYAAMDRLVAASKAVGSQLDQQIAAWGKRDS